MKVGQDRMRDNNIHIQYNYEQQYGCESPKGLSELAGFDAKTKASRNAFQPRPRSLPMTTPFFLQISRRHDDQDGLAGVLAVPDPDVGVVMDHEGNHDGTTACCYYLAMSEGYISRG